MKPNRPRCPTCGADEWETTETHMYQTKDGFTQLIMTVKCFDCGQPYKTAWSFFAQIDGGRID